LTKKTIESAHVNTNIKVFGNGKDAIDYLERSIPHTELLPELILLDLSMPIMDGWGFLEEYIQLRPSLPKPIAIYIVSSSISPHDMRRAKDISAVTDFVIKPITKEKFSEIISQLA